MSDLPRLIVCAANRHTETGLVVCGARHGDEIMCELMMLTGGLEHWQGKQEMGFIDQEGNFLTRQEAFEIANKQGQLRRRYPEDNGYLFSENLY